jgi:hypothetical protein
LIDLVALIFQPRVSHTGRRTRRQGQVRIDVTEGLLHGTGRGRTGQKDRRFAGSRNP